MFKFRSGTNGLNEELGRHRGNNDDRQWKLCGDECESVVHMLWECPAYDTTVDSGYQAHALVRTIAKIYALHNEVHYIARVKG